MTDVYCEFYQYYLDALYTPEFHVYLDKGTWGMMVWIVNFTTFRRTSKDGKKSRNFFTI